MTYINWAIAPKDAQYWFVHTGFFYKIVDGVPYYWDANNKSWMQSAVNLEKLFALAVKNPNIKTDSDHASPTTSVEFLDNSKKLQEERGKQYDKSDRERSFDKVAAMFTAATGIAFRRPPHRFNSNSFKTCTCLHQYQ